MARILVVDDEAHVRFVVWTILARAGHQVLEAADSEAALRTFRQQPADLVVYDLSLPDTDGREMIRQLRRDFPGVKAIAMSGAARSGETVPRADRTGADALLCKPFTLDVLLGAVNEALASNAPVMT